MAYRPNALGVIEVPFTFSSGSPLKITNVTLGDVVMRASIVIKTPFSDSAARLTLGTVGTPTLFMAASDSVPSIANEYQIDDSIDIAVSDIVILTISPGSSVSGSGIVYLVAK